MNNLGGPNAFSNTGTAAGSPSPRLPLSPSRLLRLSDREADADVLIFGTTRP